MQSLHTRLDYQKDQVLKFIGLFGRSHAMEEFGVADYSRFSEWIKEVTGNEHFGLNPKFGANGSQGVLNQVAIKMVRTLLDLQAENKELRKENEILKLELQRGDGEDMDQALALMEICQA